MIHIYCGEGKGKTTAAVGAAIRAAGSGRRVLLVQFFKDGSSGEIRILEKTQNIDVLYEKEYFGRYQKMTEEKKREAAERYGSLYLRAAAAAQKYDVVILDEVLSACNHGVIATENLLEFLKNYAGNRDRELILTGRRPALQMYDLADYVTEMKKEKHPFDQGVKARKGIEW